MKKITIILSLVALCVLASCDPIEIRYEMGDSITADQIVATAVPEVINGQNVNKVILECNSPINCQWSNGILQANSNYAEMLMFVPGTQTITLTGLCADGTKITKEFTVTIDAMHYEVAPEYGYFCGTGEKKWTWDASMGTPWGNGGYLSNVTPGWWCCDMAAIEGQAVEKGYPADGQNGYMTFVLNGLKLQKSDGAVGNFSFDMTKTTTGADGNIWGIGKLTTKGVNVLLGVQPNQSGFPMIYEYDILQLNDDRMYLACPEPGAGAWGTCWYWCFTAM